MSLCAGRVMQIDKTNRTRYMELRLILAHLLWNFDIERADLPGFDIWDPDDNLKHIKAFNTWNKPPLQCRLTPVRR